MKRTKINKKRLGLAHFLKKQAQLNFAKEFFSKGSDPYHTHFSFGLLSEDSLSLFHLLAS